MNPKKDPSPQPTHPFAPGIIDTGEHYSAFDEPPLSLGELCIVLVVLGCCGIGGYLATVLTRAFAL